MTRPHDLNQLPETYVETRDDLHQIAFFAISPARYRAVGRMGLEYRHPGFATPEFGGRVIRVDGDLLIDEEPDASASRHIVSVRDSTEFLGIDYAVDWFTDFHDPLQPTDPDRRLAIDPAASAALGRWFRFAWDVLGEMRSHAVEGDDPSEIQLWPEHFDAATELGDSGRGQRASYGASPGDHAHPDPYIYVAPWSDIDKTKPYWNAESFNGSILGYNDLAKTPDPVESAIAFLLEGHWILHAG